MLLRMHNGKCWKSPGDSEGAQYETCRRSRYWAVKGVDEWAFVDREADRISCASGWPERTRRAKGDLQDERSTHL
jgi:hypothetical protein